jgi:hypothetical protein
MQRSEPMLHQSRGGGGRPHEGHAQAGESPAILRLVNWDKLGKHRQQSICPIS